ncbi:MAG: hemolysin family protein [Acidaminococcaceae bacterium]|jgi:CBS domain containing-hemolysin-like protein|nr:hemolysin family protein [Acidaminococcaceae bacterium]
MNIFKGSLLSLTLVLILLVILSAFFSASETALTGSQKLRLKRLAKNGNKKAEKALKLTNKADDTLTTILIGNNIVNILAASLSAAVCTAYFGAEGLAIATIATTIVILLCGEILPKSAAKDYPEKIAMKVAPLLYVLNILLFPLNLLVKLIRMAFKKFLHTKAATGPTEDELMLMVDEVQKDGAINKNDSELIKSAIEFSDIRVREIMTPRVDFVSIDLAAGNEEALHTVAMHGFSRFPVYKEDDKEIIGMIHAKDFFAAYVNNPNFKMGRIIKNIAYVHSSTKISLVMKSLQEQKVEMAMVLDSYGTVRGLVTTEDIVEELVGEIWDEHDKVVSSFHKIGSDKYLISCSSNLQNASLLDLFKFLDLDFSQYGLENNSISGWVVDTLGDIPQKGDSFTYKNLHVTVSKTTLHRVVEIIIDVDRTQTIHLDS